MKTDMIPGATGTQNGSTGDISILNRTIPVLSGSGNSTIAMTCAAPKRDAPAALQLPENSGSNLSRGHCADGSRTFIFSWFGCELRSCPFLHNP
jgi:hypothetical protein